MVWQERDIPVTERWYRLIQGIYLLIALYIEHDLMIYGFIALLSFESITNLRLPVVVSLFRFGKANVVTKRIANWSPLVVDSERLLRLIVVTLMTVSILLFPESVWFFPWFVAAMLLLA